MTGFHLVGASAEARQTQSRLLVAALKGSLFIDMEAKDGLHMPDLELQKRFAEQLFGAQGNGGIGDGHLYVANGFPATREQHHALHESTDGFGIRLVIICFHMHNDDPADIEEERHDAPLLQSMTVGHRHTAVLEEKVREVRASLSISRLASAVREDARSGHSTHVRYGHVNAVNRLSTDVHAEIMEIVNASL